jgi:putative endonuclease
MSRAGYISGLSAERVAAWWLQAKGYRILARRLQTPLGEIDLLAMSRRSLVIVEVKQRATLALAAAALTQRQKERLARAARFALAQRPTLCNHSLRFDVVLVNRWGWPRHLVNVWTDAP